jgi:hypothetical protein
VDFSVAYAAGKGVQAAEIHYALISPLVHQKCRSAKKTTPKKEQHRGGTVLFGKITDY